MEISARMSDCFCCNYLHLGLSCHLYRNYRGHSTLHEASWGEWIFQIAVVIERSSHLCCSHSSGAGSATGHVTMQNALLENTSGCGSPSPYQPSPTCPCFSWLEAGSESMKVTGGDSSAIDEVTHDLQVTSKDQSA